MGGAVIAAAAARAHRKVISHFLSSNAVSAERAIPFETSRRLERRFFERLRDRSVILSGKNGGYYIDPPALDTFNAGQRKVAALGVTAVVLAAAAGLAIAVIA